MKYAMLTAMVLLSGVLPVSADTPRDMYTRAMAQERALRDDATKPTVVQMRRVVASYESLVRRYPVSGYSDNALWQAANLAALAYQRFGDEADKKTASRLFAQLTKGYPASKLVARASEALGGLESAARPAAIPLAAAPLAAAPPAAGSAAPAPAAPATAPSTR